MPTNAVEIKELASRVPHLARDAPATLPWFAAEVRRQLRCKLLPSSLALVEMGALCVTDVDPDSSENTDQPADIDSLSREHQGGTRGVLLAAQPRPL